LHKFFVAKGTRIKRAFSVVGAGNAGVQAHIQKIFFRAKSLKLGQNLKTFVQRNATFFTIIMKLYFLLLSA